MAGLAPAPGRVVLVGAGPGDVELLTLKAARLIAEADWLVHDALVQPEVLALARHARVISVGKRAGNPSARQSSINRILLDCAHQGGLTVRLKGGDPLIFARAQEELDVLHAAGIPVEVVPGHQLGPGGPRRTGAADDGARPATGAGTGHTAGACTGSAQYGNLHGSRCSLTDKRKFASRHLLSSYGRRTVNGLRAASG